MIDLPKRRGETNSSLISNFAVALDHLNSDDHLQRKVGYALCIPKFKGLSSEFKKIIRDKWINDPSKHAMNDKFIKLCDKIFMVK